VTIDAGLRAPQQPMHFERLIKLVHVQASGAKPCFNAPPADTAAAVRRWI